MKKTAFKDWDLDGLDKSFGLEQILEEESQTYQNWKKLAQTFEIDSIEKHTILRLQKPLRWAGKAWNELELENKFISPIFMLVEFDDRKMAYLTGVIGDYELSGIVDGMIATGSRNPDVPLFCMHKYKRSVDNDGHPDAQALGAMLVAREMNPNDKPIYGLYIVGLIWNFIILEDNKYVINKDYKSGDEELFDIFKMLKALKEIIKTELR